MNGILSRSIVAVTIMAFLVSSMGCSNYMSARLPYSATGPSYDDGRPEVWVGADVRVTRNDGSVATGNVRRITKTELVIEKAGNYGVDSQTIPIDEISKIEVEGTTPRESNTAAVLLVAGMVLIAAWVASWVIWSKSHPGGLF